MEWTDTRVGTLMVELSGVEIFVTGTVYHPDRHKWHMLMVKEILTYRKIYEKSVGHIPIEIHQVLSQLLGLLYKDGTIPLTSDEMTTITKELAEFELRTIGDRGATEVR